MDMGVLMTINEILKLEQIPKLGTKIYLKSNKKSLGNEILGV